MSIDRYLDNDFLKSNLLPFNPVSIIFKRLKLIRILIKLNMSHRQLGDTLIGLYSFYERCSILIKNMFLVV